jgi:Fe-S-cluster containining protein
MNYTIESIERLKLKGAANYKSIKKFMFRLSKMNPRKLDELMLQFHNTEFNKIDCLQCANCCKSISPAMNESDIRRLASFLKLKISDFCSRYINMDEEGDYVFKQTPCPFLEHNNYCSAYESRPRACREYPHTDRKRFYQITELTAKNYKVCPAVFNIIEDLKKSSL